MTPFCGIEDLKSGDKRTAGIIAKSLLKLFLQKTFGRMIINWRVRVQSSSSKFLYSQNLRMSEQNSMRDWEEIKFVWYQSNPHFPTISSHFHGIFVFLFVCLNMLPQLDHLCPCFWDIKWDQGHMWHLGSNTLSWKQTREIVPLRNLRISTFWRQTTVYYM